METDSWLEVVISSSDTVTTRTDGLVCRAGLLELTLQLGIFQEDGRTGNATVSP